MFKVGESAVYPAHGMAVVKRIDEREIGGKKKTFYVLQILERNLTLMVHPMVESYILRGWWNSMLRGWKKKYKTSIRVESNSSMELMEYKLFNQLGEELIT